MTRYTVSMHNGLDPFVTEAKGPTEAAHEWVNEYQPSGSCDIKVDATGFDKPITIRVNVDTTYRYNLTSA